MIGVAPTAKATPCKTERREMFVGRIFWFSAMYVIPPKQRFSQLLLN